MPSLHAQASDTRKIADPVRTHSAIVKLYTPGWEQRGRAAPQVQFVIVLSGRMEVEVPDGARAVVDPGEVLLCRDVKQRAGAT